MKKYIWVLLPLISLLTGCNHYIELDDLEVVENLGIHYQDEQFQIIATTIEKQDDQYQYKTLSATGKTIYDAIENIKIKNNKKLYIAHLDLLVVTPNLVNEKLEEVVHFFLENTESRNDFAMAISNDLEFLKEDGMMQLKDMVQISESDLGTTRGIEFEEFLKGMLEESYSYLPVITLEEVPTLDSIAIVQNQKIVTHLTKEECILYNLLTNRVQRATLDENIILSNQATIRFQKEKMKITLNLILATENENFKSQLEEKIRTMFQDYQKQNIDIFGFRKQIEISNYKFYQMYKDQLLEKIEMDFHIQIKPEVKESKEVHLS